jgi:pilus assembly protein CpaC
MNFATHDVVWKKYGIVLKVKPLADALGQMSLQIDTEVSSLDPAKAVEGIPAIITHHVSSYFDLRKPQTIALSGLIKNEEGQNSEGLPWLSRLPVLGPLFASKEFRENRSELIILVRPEIVDLQNPDLETKPQHLLSYDSYGN